MAIFDFCVDKVTLMFMTMKSLIELHGLILLPLPLEMRPGSRLAKTSGHLPTAH